jgi:hypothetical protein
MQENPTPSPKTTSIDTTASTPKPRSDKQENARRAKKRNLPEQIKAAQKDVNGREQRLAPLKLGLKNAKRRLSRLQKALAKESE